GPDRGCAGAARHCDRMYYAPRPGQGSYWGAGFHTLSFDSPLRTDLLFGPQLFYLTTHRSSLLVMRQLQARPAQYAAHTPSNHLGAIAGVGEWQPRPPGPP